MSELIVIRHAQASFLEEDYDRLSALGDAQAAKLGEQLLRDGVELDAVFVGPRVRHARTAEIAGERVVAAGRRWPEPVAVEDFDEHQVDRLVVAHAGALGVRFPLVHKLADSLRAAESSTDRHRAFQLLFEALARLWIAGRVDDAGIETWGAFRSRVERGIDRVISGDGRGRRIAVFTSVGPATVAFQRAVACSDETALETGWRLWNCSMSLFVFSGSRFTLDGFNRVPHLEGHERTYR